MVISNQHQIFITYFPNPINNWLWNFIEKRAKPNSVLQAHENKNIVIVEFNTYEDVKRVISEHNYSKFSYSNS